MDSSSEHFAAVPKITAVWWLGVTFGVQQSRKKIEKSRELIWLGGVSTLRQAGCRGHQDDRNTP
jgi:hypothetical protein